MPEIERRESVNGEMPVSDKAEQDFWGSHEFQEAEDSICCARCGWGFHDPIHKKVNR